MRTSDIEIRFPVVTVEYRPGIAFGVVGVSYLGLQEVRPGIITAWAIEVPTVWGEMHSGWVIKDEPLAGMKGGRFLLEKLTYPGRGDVREVLDEEFQRRFVRARVTR